MRRLSNIYRLGVKELWSLWRDPVMLILIAYAFTLSVYTAATAIPETLHMAPIAIVDEDSSPLSQQIASAFYPPQFAEPQMISQPEMDAGMDAGRYAFVVNIPPDFQRDLLSGRGAEVQVNVDATRMSQAFSGAGYIQQMIGAEVGEFVAKTREASASPVDLNVRMRFNPTMTKRWFGALTMIISSVTMLSIILTGAALIREREHGTIEHLLVMPVTPFEIMIAKIWSMGAVVLFAASFSLIVVTGWILKIPIQGSVLLFLTGAALHLFATTSMGIYLATLARSMPQFGLLLILTLIPMQMLSGGVTPSESMPGFVQFIMKAAPTTHFTELGQAILYRGAGIDVVWQSFAALFLIGSVLFTLSLRRFRSTISQMA